MIIKNLKKLALYYNFYFLNFSAKATEECFENTSRAIFKFNMAFDDAILEPLQKAITNYLIQLKWY